MGAQITSIAENVERIRERIASAAERVGRKPEEITLVAVSKTFSVEAIRAAHEAGVRHFGENRVQEWESKQPLLTDLVAEVTWHLVGHLQSNKAPRAARLFHTIDSLDSFACAQRLDGAIAAWAAPQARRLTVLIEVQLAPEEAKSGASEADLPAVADAVRALPHLELRGLMCIPPFFEDPEQARPYFRKLRELRDALTARVGEALPELSMGMSHDFEAAIEEGATQVRLGTAIFGPRSPRG